MYSPTVEARARDISRKGLSAGDAFLVLAGVMKFNAVLTSVLTELTGPCTGHLPRQCCGAEPPRCGRWARWVCVATVEPNRGCGDIRYMHCAMDDRQHWPLLIEHSGTRAGLTA